MYLLFNDLIYLLICEERGTIPTKRTAPLSLFRQFYKFKNAKIIRMLELSKHFSDIFYPSCLYNRFLDLLKQIILIK